MKRPGPSWIVLSRELVADFLDLLDAELEAARQELGKSWRGAGWIAALLGAAVALIFWVVALLAYALVAVFSLWLPAWGAGLTVAGLFLLTAVVLAALAWWRIKRLQNPIDVAVRRLRDHIDWWRTEVSMHPPSPEEAAELENELP